MVSTFDVYTEFENLLKSASLMALRLHKIYEIIMTLSKFATIRILSVTVHHKSYHKFATF